jgi:carboxylate-amine ligase
VQALCSRLADDYDAGRLVPPVARERIEENRWRALRHGLDGSLLDYRTGEPMSTRDRLACLLRDLEANARRLGSASMFAEASRLLLRTGSERQRALAAGEDGLRGVVDGLVRLLEEEVAASGVSPTA